jgi:hypothetical protein
MTGVSKRIAKMAVVAVFAGTLTQPVLAAAKTPERDGGFGSIIRKIILRALDTIDIGFPPG